MDIYYTIRGLGVPRSEKMERRMACRRMIVLRWLAKQEKPVALAKVAKALGKGREETRRDLDVLVSAGLVRRKMTKEPRACFDTVHMAKVVVVWITTQGLEVSSELGRETV